MAKRTLRELVELAKTNPSELTIDEIKYLRREKTRLVDAQGGKPDAAAAHRDYVAAQKRRRLASTREIGDIPPIADPLRRESCRYDLAKFIMTYEPTAKDPFSADHMRVIERIQNAIYHGGRFTEAVYRGFGKSTISEAAGVWAVLYGHKRYVPIIGANKDRASENMDSVKGILRGELIVADFPEVCYAVQRLDGIAQRAAAQTWHGVLTQLEWTEDLVVLPWIPAPWGEDLRRGEGKEFPFGIGSVILCCGITSKRVRGMKHRRPDGTILRPDFCLLDDPQDDQSAISEQLTRTRLKIITKSILQAGSHTGSMSIVMPCTVIEVGDLVEQLMDRQKFPAWQSERIPMVRKWADRHEDLWLGEYATLRNEFDQDDPDDQERAHKRAKTFYLAMREEMDAGCEVSWAHCYSREPERHEVSAIQHAYNALIDNGAEVFASEYQNQPELPASEEGQLTLQDVLGRLNNLKVGEVPTSCEQITCFVDVQGALLYWVVCAWTVDFSGYVLDYGTFPDQRRKHFTLRTAHRTLQGAYPGAGQEGCWRQGLEDLSRDLLEREWMRDDGLAMRITRMLVDANDGNAANTVYEYARMGGYPTVVMPSRGRGVGAASIPFSDYKKKPGDRVSEFNWRIPAAMRQRCRHVIYDVNFWKSFVRSRLRVTPGDVGALTIFGSDANAHQMFAEHLTSEFSTRTEGRGRTVDEWKMRPNTSENHWWDCLVGCAVAASERGCVLPGTEAAPPKRKGKRISLAAVQREKKRRR